CGCVVGAVSFDDARPPALYTLSLHDALPIWARSRSFSRAALPASPSVSSPWSAVSVAVTRRRAGGTVAGVGVVSSAVCSGVVVVSSAIAAFRCCGPPSRLRPRGDHPAEAGLERRKAARWRPSGSLNGGLFGIFAVALERFAPGAQLGLGAVRVPSGAGVQVVPVQDVLRRLPDLPLEQGVDGAVAVVVELV